MNPISLIVMGAAPDTLNLGVSALSMSIILGIHQQIENARITVLDYGRGLRSDRISADGKEIPVYRYGSVNTRRIYRRESIYNMALSSALGGCAHPGIKLIRESSAVLDISAGDSFSDIYGSRFFRSITLRKKIVLGERTPLILLPQTYGPYKSVRAGNVARDIVARSTMAWARDERSYDVLRELLGPEFDPARHRAGVDVAFTLPSVRPPDASLGGVRNWLHDRRSRLAGINVSGLLTGRPDVAAKRFGLKADYIQVVLSTIRRILTEDDVRILLVPHVLAPPGGGKSDVEACQEVASALASEANGRVAVLPGLHDPREVKWVIAQCEWFCGTRMHSTIAALSSGVPTSAIAYSPKTLGVFESCGQGEHVADPRVLDTPEMMEFLWRSWRRRAEARRSLCAAVPSVQQRAIDQMCQILDAVKGRGSQGRKGAPAL